MGKSAKLLSLGFLFLTVVLYSCRKEELPTLSTTTVTNITAISATSGGNLISDGGAEVTSRGVCWGVKANPTISDSKAEDDSGADQYVCEIVDLTVGSTYHVRAYATNSVGTAYGADLSFVTLDKANGCITLPAKDITSSGATLNGTVNPNDLSTTVSFEYGTTTSYGQTVSATQSPITGNNITNVSAGVSNLEKGTTYHFRVIATNSLGKVNGSDLSFTTTFDLPKITTTSISEISYHSAKSGGTVTSDGGATVTARGVCWSTSSNPTINDSHTSDGPGDGVFTSSITGLLQNTLYYVRAYATNSAGTAYGNEVTFLEIIPEINVCKWLNDSPCFLNLSFDDSQYIHSTIAELLDEYGFKGTFYVISNELNDSLKSIYKDIVHSGHEIGNHTANHVRLTTLNEKEILEEINSCTAKLNSYFNIKCTSLAHPYHSTTTDINKIIFSKNLFTRNYSEYYSSSRPRFDITSSTKINDITKFIDTQITNKSCCLIAGHGIDNSGSSPCTKGFLIELLMYIKKVQENNKVLVTTMSNGALYESLFFEVKMTNKIDQLQHQITIQFDYPAKEIYNNFNKLLYSFKINKNSSWLIQNNGIEYIESDTHYIYTIDLKQTKELTFQCNITK